MSRASPELSAALDAIGKLPEHKPATYSDVVSDGGMDPRNAADKAAATLRDEQREDAARMAFLAEHWNSTIEGERLHDWLGRIGTLLRHGSLRKAIDFARTPPAEAAS